MSIIGKQFKCDKACESRKAAIGTLGVVKSYLNNEVKGRMEAAVVLFEETEEEAMVLVSEYLEAVEAGAAPEESEVAAYEVALAKGKTWEGLSHGSVAAFLGTWRALFKVTTIVTTTEPAADIVAEKARIEALVFSAAIIDFVGNDGVVVVGKEVSGGVVESVGWKAGLDTAAIANSIAVVTFVFEGEPLETMIKVSSLLDGIAAAAGLDPAAEAARLAAEAARAAEVARAAAAAKAAASAAKTPRSAALEARALPGEWLGFLTQVVPWVAPPGRVPALLCHPTLATLALESFLESHGGKAVPALLAGTPGSASAVDLLGVCLGLGEAESHNPKVPAFAGPAGVTPYLLSPPDVSGTAQEVRERATLKRCDPPPH
jgi:hypothetical protein